MPRSFGTTIPTLAIIRSPLTISAHCLLTDAIRLMGRANIDLPSASHVAEASANHAAIRASCVFVLEGPHLAGILTERNIMRLFAEGGTLAGLTARDGMSQPPLSIAQVELGDPSAVLLILEQHNARHLAVLDEQGAVSGLITAESLLPHLNRVGAEHRYAEAQHPDLTDRLALAVKSAAIGIWDWDVVNDVLTWDERMYALYGLTSASFSSSYAAWAAGLHPDDRAASEHAIRQALRSEKDFDIEFRVVHPSGAIRDLKAHALIQRDIHGTPLHMIGVNFDITERKQAEIKNREMAAQLQLANQELEGFAYSVSHDLRAPLRAIDGFSSALIEEYSDQFDAAGRDYFRRIRGGVRRMSQQIDDLLRLSQVSRGEMQISKVDLSTIIRRIAAELRAAEPERQVEMVIEARAIVRADPNLIGIALDNLLQNAWKFTNQHPTARIEFGVTQIDAEKIYFVRDDGAGFDMAYVKKLFGVFQRLHDAHEFPGTGIGLVTVERVIKRHGGRVWAEGSVGQGATIYFTLPKGSLQMGV